MYGWEEEDVVWFFLIGDAPKLNTLGFNVRSTMRLDSTLTHRTQTHGCNASQLP